MDLHSDEAIERAVLTLREITQEKRGRGISAVMTLEEQIKALEAMNNALEKDAACWRALCKRMDERMTPMRSEWKIIEISPMYGADDSSVTNWRDQIEAAARSVGAA